MTDPADRAYPRNNGVPALLRSVVAFVDLLGTSVHAGEDAAQKTLERLDESLRRARLQSGIDEALSWFHASWFSDNLSIAAPLPQPHRAGDRSLEESSLGFVLVTVMWLQFRLAIDGFVLRGGVTVGLQFADNEVNFGPALVEAVRLERDDAIFPRVIVDDRMLAVVDHHFGDYFEPSENPFHHQLMRAPDGRIFVSYLGAVFEADDADEAHDMLGRHQHSILALRHEHASSDPRVVAKYEWLASYHNSFCEAFFSAWQDVFVDRVPADSGFAAYLP